VTRFTVLMPAYNAQKYVGLAIESILQQSFADFDLLVLNDGSDDDTSGVVAQYVRQDRRVHLLDRRRQGQVASRNELLGMARTDIVAWADADDVSLPGRFELQFKQMCDRPDLAVLGTMMYIVDERGRRIGRKYNPVGAEAVAAELERRVSVAQTSSMMRKAALIDVGGYREAYTTAEDYDLLLRVRGRGRLDNIDAFCVLYRQNPAGVTATNSARQLFVADLARASQRLRARGLDDPTTRMAEPPDVEDASLDEIMSDDLIFHRAVRRLHAPDPAIADCALRDLLLLSVPRRRARLLQKILLDQIMQRRFDGLSLRVLLHVLRMGPGRFLRHLLVRQPG
jgi:glycosyltransferase involved in cell wall biosynthesis